MSLNSISNLTLKIANVFESKAAKLFRVSSDKTPAQIVDIDRHQWKMYQLEEINDSMYKVTIEDNSSKISCFSGNNYWDYALEYCGVYS